MVDGEGCNSKRKMLEVGVGVIKESFQKRLKIGGG